MWREGNHKLTDLLKTVHTQFILFEEDAPFINLNHPHEYEEAVKRITSI
jgi:molybdopterin-guanine dinucleotide biosynthesis protein A